MSKAVTRIGETTTLTERRDLGEVEEAEDNGRKTRRVRSVVSKDGSLFEAWLSKSARESSVLDLLLYITVTDTASPAVVHLTRQSVNSSEQIERAAFKLEKSGTPFKAFDMHFVDSEQLVIAIASSGATGESAHNLSNSESLLTNTFEKVIDNQS